MLRDLTLIFSVLLSIVSVAFGAYKNIEAGNAQGFAYQQTYRVLNTVQQANISGAAKAAIADSALGNLSTPAPVIDLSRSSAASPTTSVCSDQEQATCTSLAAALASANALCAKTALPADCTAAQKAKASILTADCISCFTP
ncbi:MAG TPA: hypothetical protein VMJ72_01045 [Candidatus Paceibacterota bacterium]|nr:hypothetical protein [Candidatus Paceibacterota bacterium]